MRIALIGDIAFFGRCTKSEYFIEISEYLSHFDYVVGNLETPFSAVKETYGAKSAYIFAEPQIISILTQLHINAVTLANNHMFDYGKEGYELTKKLLTDNGIKWFGTEGKELRVEIGGNRITFAGYCCYTTNPLQCVRNGEYGVNAYNLQEAKKFIVKSISDGLLPIIAVHAGIEHVNYPSIDHIRASRQLSSEGSYVYYGHHPHVIQGVEEYKGSLIAHSLGNFCFDNVYTDTSKDKPLIELTENNRIGMILELSIDGNVVKCWKEQIIYIGKDGITLVETPSNIHEYNKELKNCENNTETYNTKRALIIYGRIAERKTMRTMGWYLKRLRPRYFQLMMDMRRNKCKYNENVKKYL